MKLIEFKGGDAGSCVFINPDNVCSLYESVTLVGDTPVVDPTMTEINTADGKSPRVQGSVADVAAILTKDS